MLELFTFFQLEVDDPVSGPEQGIFGASIFFYFGFTLQFVVKNSTCGLPLSALLQNFKKSILTKNFARNHRFYVSSTSYAIERCNHFFPWEIHSLVIIGGAWFPILLSHFPGVYFALAVAWQKWFVFHIQSVELGPK